MASPTLMQFGDHPASGIVMRDRPTAIIELSDRPLATVELAIGSNGLALLLASGAQRAS